MQQPMPHQVMGYDRAITMFSPDGRLLQVEYAKKTVKQGSTAIGITYKEGVLLVTDKRIVDKLIIPDSVEKIFQIDDHIIATAAGILSDARVLVERSQTHTQQHKVTYDTNADVGSIVRDIANLKQMCTQSGGLRPFGVSLLIAGIDRKGPVLYETDPTGIFFQYKASVIGEGQQEIEEVISAEYKDNMSLDNALKLGLKAMHKFLGEELTTERIDAAFVSTDTEKMERLTNDKLSKLMKEIKK